MFVELVVNYETNKRKLVRITDISRISYNGKDSIHIQLIPTAPAKTKSFGLHYPTKEIAECLYIKLAKELGALGQIPQIQSSQFSNILESPLPEPNLTF